MKRVKELKKLEEIAEAAFQQELGKLAAITAKEAAPNGELSRLEQMDQRENDTLKAAGDFSLSTLQGRSEKWQVWLQSERAKLRRELALIAAEKEEQLIKTQRAFGRKSALEELKKRHS